MRFATKVLHSGIYPDSETGAIMTPIYQTSTYVQSAPGIHKGYEYARTQNPTRTVLENNLASLENAKYGLCFASGMSATDAILRTLNSNDEVIVHNDLYGGTYRIMTQVYAKYGIKFHFVDCTSLDNVHKIITSKVRMLWLETPSNPMLHIIDLQAIRALCPKGIKIVVDNTFATPYLQLPINFGIDIVCHSVTKYLSGHSDVVMGAIMVNNDSISEELKFLQNSCGAIPSPNDCFLVLRGLKTLHLRMQKSCDNAIQIAQLLLQNPKVKNVFFPGLSHHKGHEIAKKQMSGFGGIVSFNLKIDTIYQAKLVLTNTKLFALAESLGGVESLIGHPATMTHASIPLESRLSLGITDSLIRLSVGVEDIDDLLEDLTFALNTLH